MQRRAHRTRPSVALVVDCLPPWLVANFNATIEHINFTALVLDTQPLTGGVEAPIRFGVQSANDRGNIISWMEQTLTTLRPDAILTSGWSGSKNFGALSWAARSRVPAIVTTDSNEHDFPRSGTIEMVKRRLLSLFSAGWAAGTRSAAYLEKLGMPKERIVVGPVNTIDLRHFASGAEAARNEEAGKRASLGLPKHYFLSVSRLAPEKNLPGLVRAFAKYRARAGSQAWDLVVVGEGPSRPEIERVIAACGLGSSVMMPGWISFADLPAYYGLASAFVLASVREPWGVVVNEAAAASLPLLVSKRAGSAPELVTEGCNGFTFDPSDIDEIAARLWQLGLEPVDLAGMGSESKRIVAHWSPENYAASMRDVTRVALEMDARKLPLFDGFILRQLASAWLYK